MKTMIKQLALLTTGLLFAITVWAHGDHQDNMAHLVFKKGALHIHAQFPEAPMVGQEATLLLETHDPQTHQVINIDDQIEVSLWMPSMGHGSAPTQIERVQDDQGNVITGLYVVRNVYFTMGGDWEVRVTLTDAQGNKETQSFNVHLDGGMNHGGGDHDHH